MELAKHHVPVQAVYVCVGTDEAQKNISHYSLADKGMPCAIEYHSCRQYAQLTDQVCERDFYPGMPLSGRQHANGDGSAFPYLLPWGRPTEWGSIPEREQRRFSQLCIQNAIELYQCTEKVNNIRLKLRDMSRKFLANHGSVKLCDPSESMIDYLHRMYKLV